MAPTIQSPGRASSPPTPSWHHAAATYDGVEWNLYLDGALDGNLVVNQPANALTNAITAVGSALQTGGTATAAGFFAGVIDEVRIWSFARSASQILADRDNEITVPTTGLLGRWGMNEGTGTSLGNTAVPAVTGATIPTATPPAWVAGARAQYATLGGLGQLRASSFTLELWLRRTGAGVGTSTGTGGIASAIPLITKGRAEGETQAADVNYLFGIDATSGRLVADFEEAQVAQGGTSPGLNHPITGNGVIAADGVWHHAAVTYDGTTWNLYLDGNPDGSLAVGRPANALNNVVTTVGTALTTTNIAAGSFAGVVDEVRIWNVARTAGQILADKNNEITGPTAGLIGRWGLNEGTGSSLADSAGGSITGAAVANPAWVDGFVPPVVNGAPAAPTVIAPSNTATGIETSPTLNVGVSDPDSDPLTVTFFGRPLASGNFTQIAQNTNVTTATTSAAWNAIGAGQTFEWFVTVADAGQTTTGPTWTFTTTPSADPVFVGAGDIADCTRTQDSATAAVDQRRHGRRLDRGRQRLPGGHDARELDQLLRADMGWRHQGPNAPDPGQPRLGNEPARPRQPRRLQHLLWRRGNRRRTGRATTATTLPAAIGTS